MKIDDTSKLKTGALGSPEVSKATVKADPAKPEVRPAAAGTTESGEKVTLSLEESRLQALVTKIQQLPDVDEEKVARIREALQNREYTPDLELIARRILLEESAYSK